MGPRVNEKIFAKSVQVISNDGQNLGVMDTNDALNMAYDMGYTTVPLYHPNYLILKPSAKRDVWNALQNVQKMLKNP